MNGAILNKTLCPGTYYIVIDADYAMEGTYEISVNIEPYTAPDYDEDFETGAIPASWQV